MLPKITIKEIFLSFRQRMVLIVVGMVIVVTSLLFTNNMARTLREKEQKEIELWAYAKRLQGNYDSSNPLAEQIVNSKNNIPLVWTDENARVVGTSLIPDKIANHPGLMRKELERLSSINEPLQIITRDGTIFYLFYGESKLLKSLMYFPLIQLFVIGIFAMFGYLTFRSSRHDEQNRVWIGLAKETAHQLGTPTSSLLGWVEYLRNQPVDQTAVEEMNNDLKRLMKVVDRFSKIGSETVLSEGNINEIVGSCVQYFQSRIPKNVTLSYNGFAMAPLKAMVNAALFEWVVENLLKNALDALQGKGQIIVKLSDDINKIHIDVSDTGKGIAKANFKRIFEPGFTTKTRGWGLGLSLSRRVMEDYHRGSIFVVESEIDKGTTIRITLKKLYT